MTIRTLLLSAAASCAMTSLAQEPRLSSSMYLNPQPAGATLVPFSIFAEGVKLPIRWGLDVAWDSEQNVRKGINHIGKENISIMRSSFQTTYPLVDDKELTASQISRLDTRTKLINLVGTDVDIVLNEDQEAGIAKYYVENGVANTDHWAELINASVKWLSENYPKHKVVAISPYNEPDFGWGQGNLASFKEIAQKLKTNYPLFADIAITGGNTLNCDEALKWYNGLKPYVDWGNTHQLAGSFDTYANFFKTVAEDGKYPYADELHNVGEAMVGAEYGMKMGVWWGFDSRARGEFCRISNSGSRLAYAENRPAWTSAAVYRDETSGQVKAFIGSSERQANTSSFLFVSKDKDVYYDGYGPVRELNMSIPGGTGYQNGQTNAERVIDVTWGADVQPSVINGRYRIMNRSTRYVAAEYGSDNIALVKSADNSAVQLWDVAPASDRIGGDYSFLTFTNVADGRHMNVLNFSTSSGGNVMAYDGGNSSNEQWYLKYYGNGCYYILNRESGLCLMAASSQQTNGTNVVQGLFDDSSVDKRNLRLWQFLPEGAACEIIPPAVPKGLTARASTAAVTLQWTANTDADLAGYMVLRADAGDTNWNTIARKVQGTSFTDNTCLPGHEYQYAVKSIDMSDNMSKACTAVEAAPLEGNALVANWQFDNTLADNTDNALDVAVYGKTVFSGEHKSGEKSLYLSGTDNYVQLPYTIASYDKMTIAMWVNWRNTASAWQRLFDFGNGVDEYMFLTPSNGTAMRFAIKNGGDEQGVTCTTKLAANSWHHVAVTIGDGTVRIFVDGDEVAQSTGITIKPSDFNPVLNYVGRSQFSADPMFKGYIDDVRIYNYDLQAEEVKTVMADLTNGVQSVEADETGNAATYTIDGKAAGKNAKGLLVRKAANGKVTKVIEK